MVLVGKTNKEIVSMLNQKGAKAVGICGLDGKLIECEKMTKHVNGEECDLGYVGNITKINYRLLSLMAKDEYIPVVAPIGVITSYSIHYTKLYELPSGQIFMSTKKDTRSPYI